VVAARVLSVDSAEAKKQHGAQPSRESPLSVSVGQCLRQDTYDFVMVEYVVNAHALEALRYLPLGDRPVALIDTYDVYHERCAALRRHGVRLPGEMSRDREQALLTGFDIIVAIQDEDRRELAAMCPAKTVVTCLPCRDADPVPPSSDRPAKSLGFFGGRGYSGPNEQGLAQFLVHAWPLIREVHPTATLSVFGDTRDAFRGRSFPGVQFEGYVLDLRAAYSRVEVVIDPVTFGGGLKTKVLEALSYGRPVVATTHSAIGYPNAGGHGLFVAQDWRSFAGMVNELFAQPGRAIDEGCRAAAYVEAHFQESRVMAELLGAMESDLERRRSRSRACSVTGPEGVC